MDPELLKTVSNAFDARSATYDESTMHRELAATVADFADLTAVEDVVDIATGTGLVLRARAHPTDGSRVPGGSSTVRDARSVGDDGSGTWLHDHTIHSLDRPH